MKLDAFDQYIHDQYQGYEVTPPAALEDAVMGKLRRMKWARRLRAGAVVLAVAAGGGFWWGTTTTESVAETVAETVAPAVAPAVRVDEPEEVHQPMAAEPTTPDARTAVEIPVATSVAGANEVSSERPAAMAPLDSRIEPSPLAESGQPEKSLQRDRGGSELWIISAEVEVKDR